jgi:hypothetical protein
MRGLWPILFLLIPFSVATATELQPHILWRYSTGG